ncbi:hypothetical protein K438DRAFT_1780011 [Mycena galopus ATCC 62051]|nr:hypothetical protein K438DRAFT_1780011 [Mycena galopus ATCC 62051]
MRTSATQATRVPECGVARPQSSYSNRVATYHSASPSFLGDFDPALLPPSLSSYLPHSTHPTSRLLLAQMPWQTSYAVADIPDDEHQKILARIRRMPPTDVCAALLNLRPYLEKPGHVYVHVRLHWDILQNSPTIADDDDLDYLDIKVGEAIDMDARRAGHAKCDGKEIIWCFYYKTDHPKLIERLTHLTLAQIGAKRVPYPCKGCAVRHREHFSEKCAALEFVASIIKDWIRKIREPPVRHPMYDE